MIVPRRHQYDAVAEANPLSALRARRKKHLGCRLMGILFEEMVLHLPCVVDADSVSEFALFEGLAIDAMFRIGVPRPWNLVFIEDAELHSIISCGAPSLR